MSFYIIGHAIDLTVASYIYNNYLSMMECFNIKMFKTYGSLECYSSGETVAGMPNLNLGAGDRL